LLTALRRLIASLFLLASALGLPATAQARSLDSWDICAAYITQAERALELPVHLLAAISKAEAGRWNKDRQALIAWPWTVMAEGRGRYLPSREAAMAEVRALQAKGVRNIDVGCMQVNLQHHSKAFDSLEEAFDPATNVAYAATFLSVLRDEARSWTRAIGHYHSRTPALGGRYRAKVFRIWNEEKHRAYKARQEARADSAGAESAAPPAARALGQIPPTFVVAQNR